MQNSLLDVQILYEVDSNFDGKDLKKIARGDDGRDYAVKRMADGPFIPISEWVGYNLWQACGLLTPEYSVLHYGDGQPPAFGSRIELTGVQIKKDPDKFTVAGFFRPHLQNLALTYPLDAFLPNHDRHGRNFLERPTLTAPALLSIDFSRAWSTTGLPCGDVLCLEKSQTSNWWRHFVNAMHLKGDFSALEKVAKLPNDWMSSTLKQAPLVWLNGVGIEEFSKFWENQRRARIEFAKQWIDS